MSVTLDLPHELEDELAAEAAQLGLPLPEYILRVLSTTVATGDKPKTGADLVEYWQNEEVIGTRPDITDSQEHAPMYLVDSDVLVDIQRGHTPAIAWFASLTTLPSVPGFVVMELVQDAQNAQQVRQALKLVAPLPVVWPAEADCSRALIAACATGLSGTLCTFNVKRYRVVPGLVLDEPYAR